MKPRIVLPPCDIGEPTSRHSRSVRYKCDFFATGVAVLKVILRPDYATLATALAERLGESMVIDNALDRALTPEWIVTPSAGARQWLRHEMAHQLGASGEGRRDGIVANWHLEFPGALTERLTLPHLREAYGVDRDPWSMPELTFRLLEVAQRHDSDLSLRPLRNGDGDVLLSRVRHFADLFDRYHVWRPDMVVKWSNGEVVDSADSREVEQAAMWRRLREEIGIPSTPERWNEAVHRASRPDTPLRDRWPNASRVSIFGLTAFPGGLQFLDVVAAMAVHLDVAVFLVHGFDDAVLDDVRDRMDFKSELMQMWGGLPLANAPIIDDLIRRADVVDRHSFAPREPTNFLAALQHTLRRDEVVPVVRDGTAEGPSIVEHWCHGPMRQAEVLRDAIRHDLDSDFWSPPLQESEILVVCSDIEMYAPLIRTAFGPSRTDSTESAQPALAYRIIDPRLVSEGSYLRSIRQGLELVRSRCRRSDVLSFLESPPVAARRRLGVDELEILSSWTKEAGIRWGLNEQHREDFGVSGLGDINTWRAGLDRIFLGVAVENPSFRSVRDILPVEVLAGRIDLVGNLTEVIETLEASVQLVRQTHSLAEWLEWFGTFTAALFASGGAEENEATRVARAVADIRRVAESVDVAMTYGDFLAVLEESWSSVGSVSRLLTGGITVTSVDTLRWIPFRSVYLVGFDDETFTRPDWSADDLRRREPRPGDISPNDDARSRLSELILSAEDRLTIFRTYRDVTNNTEVDFGVAFAEYRQAVQAVTAGSTPLTMRHPRHGFSDENFDPASEVAQIARESNLLTGPWSMSALDHRIVVRAIDTQDPLEIEVAAPVNPPLEFSISDLATFLKDPVGTHLRVALGIREDALSLEERDDLDIAIAARERPHLLRRLFEFATRDDGDVVRAQRALLRSGDIPPEDFAPGTLLTELTQSLIAQYREVTWNAVEQQCSIEIPVGKFVVRDDVTVHLREGELTIAHIVTSEIRARHVFLPWLEAVAVRAVTDADVPVTLQLVCLKEGIVSSVTCPVSLTPAEASDVMKDMVKLYFLNLERPIPYDSEIDIHETWSDLDEEEWQGEKMNRTHCYLGKPAWRLVFGDFSADDVVAYEPSPGYSIAEARRSIAWFLSHGVDLAQHLKKAKSA